MDDKRFRDLVSVLDRGHPVIIQAHDYPDHDAIASGFALSHLLTTFGYWCELCYGGDLLGYSIGDAISMLNIPAVAASSLTITDRSQVVLVDGYAGNKNVTDLSGDLIGIIDHHKPPEIPDCRFFDIRPEVGSCATIIYQYYLETDTDIGRDIATALLMGLMMDTANMTRGVAPVDLAAFSGLFFKGDWEKAAYILRNCLSVRDLPVFRHALTNCRLHEDVCFVELEKSCRPELLGLISDYFLSLKEVLFVVTSETDEEECRISIRSEDPDRPADLAIKLALKGVGAGGGHIHMSGGSIPAGKYPGSDWLRERFLSVLADLKK